MKISISLTLLILFSFVTTAQARSSTPEKKLIEYLETPTRSNARRLARLLRRNPELDVNIQHRWRPLFNQLTKPCNRRFNRNEPDKPICRVQVIMANILKNRSNLDLSPARSMMYLTRAIEFNNPAMAIWLLENDAPLHPSHTRLLARSSGRENLYNAIVPRMTREHFLSLGDNNRSLLYLAVSANNFTLTAMLLEKMHELELTLPELEAHYQESIHPHTSFRPLPILVAAVKQTIPNDSEARPHYNNHTYEADTLAMINLLLENGADPNARDFMGHHILFKAVENCWYSQARALVLGGANPNISGRFYHSPLQIVLDREDIEMAQFLRNNGATLRFNSSRRRHSMRPRACPDS